MNTLALTSLTSLWARQATFSNAETFLILFASSCRGHDFLQWLSGRPEKEIVVGTHSVSWQKENQERLRETSLWYQKYGHRLLQDMRENMGWANKAVQPLQERGAFWFLRFGQRELYAWIFSPWIRELPLSSREFRNSRWGTK